MGRGGGGRGKRETWLSDQREGPGRKKKNANLKRQRPTESLGFTFILHLPLTYLQRYKTAEHEENDLDVVERSAAARCERTPLTRRLLDVIT